MSHFSRFFSFEFGTRCFLNLKVAGWRADGKNKKRPDLRSFEAQLSNIEQAVLKTMYFIRVFANRNLKLSVDTVIYSVGRSVVGQRMNNQNRCIL